MTSSDLIVLAAMPELHDVHAYVSFFGADRRMPSTNAPLWLRRQLGEPKDVSIAVSVVERTSLRVHLIWTAGQEMHMTRKFLFPVSTGRMVRQLNHLIAAGNRLGGIT